MGWRSQVVCGLVLACMVMSARLMDERAARASTGATTPVEGTIEATAPTPSIVSEMLAPMGRGARCAPSLTTVVTGDVPAFARSWSRDEGANARGGATGPWTWGPRVILSAGQPYRQAPGGQRQVWYWDKGRMELAGGGTDTTGTSGVTLGLLARELITGQVQLGDAEYVACTPASIPVAGDRHAPNIQTVTYADLRPLTSIDGRRFASRVVDGAIVERVLPGGNVIVEARLAAYEAHAAANDAVLGHAIPDVFTTSMSTERLFRLAGHPLTNPYWAVVPVDGVPRDVLLQVFERRVLTYTPSNPAGWQVEWGNTGRHYLEWRYGGVDEAHSFTPAPVADVGGTLDVLSSTAARIALERLGYVGVAVVDMDTGARYAFQGSRPFPMYSTAKVPIMLAVLERARQDGRSLGEWERGRLAAMIRDSDNNSATELIIAIGGAREVEHYLRAIGIEQTRMDGYAWGLSTTTAEDMARLLAKLGDCSILEPDLCAYGLDLMRGVVSEQRWGISTGLRDGDDVALKNGWSPDTAGWSVNSIGLVRRGDRRYAITVYTNPSPSREYGIETIEQISVELHRALQ